MPHTSSSDSSSSYINSTQTQHGSETQQNSPMPPTSISPSEVTDIPDFDRLIGVQRHRMDRGGSQNGSTKESSASDDDSYSSGLDENDELRGYEEPHVSQSPQKMHERTPLERNFKRMSVQKELSTMSHDDVRSEPLSDDVVQWIHKDLTDKRKTSSASTCEGSQSQPPSISVTSHTGSSSSETNSQESHRSRGFYRNAQNASSAEKIDSPKRVGFQILKKYEERQVREEKRAKLKKKTEFSSNITHKLVSPYQIKLLWQEAPKHVFIAPNNYNVEVRKYFKKVVEYLYDERQCMVVVEPEIKEAYPQFTHILSWSDANEKAYILKSVDLAICMGGDGTVLHCVRQFNESCPPVLGFGMGSIGFLTLFDVRKYKSIISKVLAKSIHISTRARLSCTIERHDGTTEDHDTYQVMNELVVDRGPSPYLTSLDTFCNGKLITNVQADGLIVATPNGSSAYNMSAGGSIVHPSVVCMLLTPICPHSLSFRPIILPDSVKLKIQVPQSARTSAYLSFDGSNRQELRKGDSVHIETSEWPVPLIITNDATSAWFRDLSESFGWSKRKQQIPFS